MGQTTSLELVPRRWQRRALPVELCLPWSCHIPSCKRTIRLFRSHCRSGHGSSFASAKKSGTPPGIRTRNFMFLKHARIPIPPAGQTKSPGTLRCNPGFGRKQTQFRRQLSPSVPVARARAWPNARYSASRAMPFGSRPIRGCNVVQSISILMVFVVAGPVLTLLFLRR